MKLTNWFEIGFKFLIDINKYFQRSINIFEMFSICICTIIKVSLNVLNYLLMSVKNVLFNWNQFEINLLTLLNWWVFFSPGIHSKVIAI